MDIYANREGADIHALRAWDGSMWELEILHAEDEQGNLIDVHIALTGEAMLRLARHIDLLEAAKDQP